MNGKSRVENGRLQIDSAFQRALQRQTAAFMPYFTLGYPDIDTSLAIIEAVAAHSDLLELGIPFSDPLADGPTIQNSTQVALENGVTVAACLDMVARLREGGVQTPACFMTYYNPVLAFGEERFVQQAVKAGVQGLIIPDLPPEESDNMARLAAESGMAYIYFLAPTSNEARIQEVSQRATGFIYLVSVTGVTGARSSLQQDLRSFIHRARGLSSVPLAVGFGISTPEQAASVGKMADGVIVGSALINAVAGADEKPAAAAAFSRAMQRALSS